MSLISLIVFVFSSLYMLAKQKLVLGRSSAILTESRLIGMAIPHALLVSFSLLLSASIFSTALVISWPPSLSTPPRFNHYFAVAQLVALFGLVTGSLGNSFEGQSYIRHVAYVDEAL